MQSLLQAQLTPARLVQEIHSAWLEGMLVQLLEECLADLQAPLMGQLSLEGRAQLQAAQKVLYISQPAGLLSLQTG